MFKRFSRQRKCKMNNSGSTLMVVIVTIALISVLATVLMSISYMNYSMKVTEYNSKKNFYTAEVVLDQINVGLQKEMSDALEDAYIRSMQRYTLDEDVTRNENFANYYIQELTGKLRTAALDTKYQIPAIDTDGDGVDDCGLVHYLDSTLQAAYANGDLVISSDEAKMQSVSVAKTNAEGAVVYEAKGLVLYDLHISYTDANDFTTVIETDIRLKTPSLTLVTKTAMPNVFDYCLVADAGITGGTTGVTSTFKGNIFAGADTGDRETEPGVKDLGGIDCPKSHAWKFTGDTRVVSAGPLDVKAGANLEMDSSTNFWVNNIVLSKDQGSANSGKLKLLGQTFVKDDLTIEGKGAEVTLSGEYLGFGYGAKAEESSAIILNGTEAVLDMTALDKLMLGGNAYIQTSKLTYTTDEGETTNGTDILTGNALAVKTDQIAYLVPAECVGVVGTKTLIGKNPMTKEEYELWKQYATDNTEGYQLVSLTKEVSILGKSLGEFELNSPAYKTIFREINGDTLCYLYLDLTRNGAADYYKKYYYAAETKMNRYITAYNNRILMDVSDMEERLTRGTTLAYALDAGDVKGDITLVENTINDKTTVEQLKQIENDYEVNAGRYARLKAKLEIEQSDVTAEELAGTVYSNLIDDSAMSALSNNNEGIIKTYDYTGSGIGPYISAVFVNNRNKEPYYYTQDKAENKGIYVIIATGDVCLRYPFEGLVITDGKVIMDAGATSIQPNKSMVLKTLRQPESSEEGAISLIARYFKNGNKYSLDTQLSGEVTNSMSGQSMAELIVYENWKKQ